MPGTYCYTCEDCGTTTETYRPAVYRDVSVVCSCGGLAGRDIGAEHGARPWTDQTAGNWKDFSSEAAGIHPDQIPEAMAIDTKRGVPTEYKPDGRPIFRDRSHRRSYLQLHRMVDLDGGYAD